MVARLVLPGTAPETEWLNARRSGITASEIAVILGLAPASWDSPYSLYWRKKGELPPQDDSMAMALGRHLEAFVACEFLSLRQHLDVWGTGRELFAHPDRTWQMATPDRLIFDRQICGSCDAGLMMNCTCPAGPEKAIAVLECKTSASYDGWGDDGTDVIPVHYRCQVLWQMDVMGVTTGYVACLFLHSRQLRVYELALDDDAAQDLEVMRAAAQTFIYRLQNNDPPPVDWAPATTEALKHLHPELKDETAEIGPQLAGWWQAACRDYNDAKQRKRTYENRIREASGAAARIALKDGTPVATRQVYDVSEHVRKASRVDKLVPARRPATPTEEDPT